MQNIFKEVLLPSPVSPEGWDLYSSCLKHLALLQSIVNTHYLHLLRTQIKSHVFQSAFTVFSLHIGQGEIILHTYSFLQSSQSRIPAIPYIIIQHKKNITPSE